MSRTIKRLSEAEEYIDKAVKFLKYLLAYENKNPSLDEDFPEYLSDIKQTISALKEIKEDATIAHICRCHLRHNEDHTVYMCTKENHVFKNLNLKISATVHNKDYKKVISWMEKFN